MANTKLTRNNNSGDSRRKMTWSWWIKRSKLGLGGGENSDIQYLYNQYRSADNYNSGVLFQSDDSIRFWDYGGSSNDLDLQTTRLFRDTNGFYHIVLAIDTTQATASNRIKLYINGVQETAFDVATYPAQNHEVRMGEAGSAQQQQLGVQGYGSTYQSYFDGVMSHVHFIDGTAYDATAFGSTDATTGEWQINTSPSVTYGTNGFFILKDGNSLTDQSPNTNNWTLGAGTLTKTEDNPSNVFATFNPLIKATTTFSNGNTTGQTQNSNNYLAGMSTLSMPKGTGIYYCEMKLIAESFSGESCIGVACEEAFTLRDAGTLSIAGGDYNWGIRNNNGLEYYDGITATSKHGNFTPGDIMGVYFDSTNTKLTFSKNGGWWNGTSSWTGTSPDLTNYFVGTSSGNYQTFFFNCGDTGGTNAKWSVNFGNGFFGTTAVSSAGTNTSGQVGIFEYNMPTNSKVLSTKGLNT